VGPPLREDGGDAPLDDAVQAKPDWDLAAHPVPDSDVDQRINW
jgi:hypothetical protein